MTHRYDLCTPPTLIATTTEKYANFVVDATTELHQPVQSILSALDRRAIALTKLANFESALADARFMRQLSSSSALGYIREANIYSKQGKQRCVMDICMQGLSHVDTKDLGYAVLQQVRMAAEQRTKIGIDFVRELPIDIVITTLIPIIMRGSYINATSHFLDVSDIWRDRFIQSSGGLLFHTGLGERISPSLQVRHVSWSVVVVNVYGNVYVK